MSASTLSALLSLLAEAIKDAPELIAQVEKLLSAAKGQPVSATVTNDVAQADAYLINATQR